MRRRRLGATDIEVPVLAFGAYAIGGWYWGESDDAAAVDALRAAVDRGMNAVDTAPVYGLGHSEELVGRALRGRRDEVVLMTKVGMRWDDPRGPLAAEVTPPGGRRVPVRANLRPDSVRAEVEASLGRLGVEHVDLVQVHRPDPETPIADTMGALAELRAEGKLGAIGVSNYTVAQIEEARRALGDVPLASDQPPYGLLDRGIERDLLPYARATDLGILAYSPLAQGLLTGAVTAERVFPETDGRSRGTRFLPGNRARVNALLREVVSPIAAARGATVAQVVLAWTIAQPGVTCALVGARDPGQVRENAAAAAVELSPEELARIGEPFAALELERLRPGLLRRAWSRLAWEIKKRR